ncbi:MAG: hypothetical protein QM728_14350 [Gordonia sp. (in: high G+C Gram-positive bacteria)]|uniref:hypothetical protein n=1 Tax=Gordonia sp. (in: high G+C Gram-positive bacteria) TaxID=84139 RepID=UPI0039E51BC1
MTRSATRNYALWAAVTALIAGGMSALPWVSMSKLGAPVSWAGLGFYYGEISEVRASIVPLGWVVVFVAFEALTLLGVELFAAGNPRVEAVKKWLYVALSGLAAAVAVLMMVIVIAPSLLYGNAFAELAAQVDAPAPDGLGRNVLVLPAILGVFFWLAVTSAIAVGGFRKAGQSV